MSSGNLYTATFITPLEPGIEGGNASLGPWHIVVYCHVRVICLWLQ
jgi:hypothetical protein